MWSQPLILATLAVGAVTTLLLCWRAAHLGRRLRALEGERASREAAADDAVREAQWAAKLAARERDDALFRAEEAEARWAAAWRLAPLAILDDAGRLAETSPRAAHLARPLAGRALATGTLDLPKGLAVRIARAGDVALLTDATPERELAEDRAEVAALEDTAFEGIALVRNDKIVECNAAFARLCGKLPHQLTGTPLRTWLAPELGRATVLHCADGRSLPIEAIARITPGGTRVVHVRPGGEAAPPPAAGPAGPL